MPVVPHFPSWLRSSRKWSAPLLAALGLAAGAELACLRTAQAHGDVHEAINALSWEIAASPQDASLYLRRGQLRRLDGEQEGARADYERAAALDGTLAAVDLARGELFAELHEWKAALEALDRYVQGAPKDPNGRELRGQVLAQVGRHAEAATEFAAALEAPRAPRPELYLDQAAALAALGRTQDAVKALEAGLRRLGSVVTLELRAVELELQAGDVGAALARVDRLTAAAPRQEVWLVRRGEILDLAGRPEEARQAYQAAAAAAETLPEHRRGTAANLALVAKIRSALARPSSPSPPP